MVIVDELCSKPTDILRFHGLAFFAPSHNLEDRLEVENKEDSVCLSSSAKKRLPAKKQTIQRKPQPRGQQQ
jgi:hypothetical protein